MPHDLLIFLETLFFIYISFLAGDIFFHLTGIKSASPLVHRAYAILAGYVIFAVAGLLLGLTGALTPFVLRAFFIMIIAGSSNTIASHLFWLKKYLFSPAHTIGAIKNLLRDYPVLKVILALWLITNFIFAFVPITGHDTKDYHLPIITSMAERGVLNFSSAIPEYRWMPLFGEILYAIPFVAFGAHGGAPFVFQLSQYSVLVLLSIVIYDFLSRRTKQKLFALAAILFILAITDFQREILHGGYIDVLVYLFGIASSLLIIDVCEKRSFEVRALTLSAMFLGFALGTKETAGVIAIINYLFLGIGFIRHRMPLRRILMVLIIYSLIVVAIAGFWYAKNAIVFGNPLYLGGKEFGETIVIKRTLLNFLLFPFYKFGTVSPTDSVSRLIVLGYFIASYALAGFFLLFRRRIFTLGDVLLFAFVQMHLVIVFFISHHTRYFLPAIIVLPLFIGLLLDRLSEVFRARLDASAYRAFFSASIVCIYLVAIILFIGNIRYFHVKFLYKTGVLTETEYIKQIGSQ